MNDNARTIDDDIRDFGIGFEVDGQRVDPRRVKMRCAQEPEIVRAMRDTWDSIKAPPNDFVLVPRVMHLDADALAGLGFVAGSAEGEDLKDPTDPSAWSDAILCVGTSMDDQGKESYGLFAYSADYPEEGCVPLVEFDDPSAAAQVKPELAQQENDKHSQE